ncbi:MAG: transcriptional regulator [Desulfovibrio sp.]|jgi:YHS domain-containing protein|nr:transcriptional regulator [Desulfovibrio sp.]
MIKWLLLVVAAFVLYKLITNDRRSTGKTEQKNREKRIASGELVQDPVCKAYVDAESSIKLRDGAAVYHFCGYECRTKFIKKLEEDGRVLPDFEGREKDDE